MTAAGGKWDDLAPRVVTGGALVVLGVVAIWLGGTWFAGLTAVVTGLIFWEMRRMVAPDRAGEALRGGLLVGVAVLLARVLPEWGAAPVLVAAVLVSILELPAGRRLRPALYGLGMVVAGYGLVIFRDGHGPAWLLWLVLVVVATDIAGYFAGKSIGGVKFWPSISPKKTWAGILAGWAAAAVVGAGFALFSGAGVELVWIAVLVSFASQLGDIAESALKRRAGVKDSSALLPGHGGLWDRFDGLLGAALMMLLFAQIQPVPMVAP